MDFIVRDDHARDLVERAEWGPLAQEYYDECASNPVRAAPSLDMDKLHAMEDCGVARVLGVYVERTDGRYLVGAAYFILGPSLYEADKIDAVCEFIFVRKAWRRGSLGLRLMREIESRAAEQGARGVTYSAPVGGPLVRLCAALGMKRTHEVFFKPV